MQLLLLALLLAWLPAQAAAQLEDADLAWASRAEQLDGRMARPERIEEAIRLYRAALDSGGASLEERWKLLRALHYLIDFSTAEESRKDAAMEEALELAKRSVEVLEEGKGDARDRARLYFRCAIAWGTRAQRVGLLTIVREGVATQMHDYAEQALALDPTVDRGGPLRLLSRLHGRLPRVPFVSGWVDREKSLALAERAYADDPEHPGNRLILALALLERAPERSAEAEALLESVAESTPDPAMLAEWLAIREQARERLAELSKEAR